MFAYCNNNPYKYTDQTGSFPVLAICVLAVCTIGGGVLGAMSDEKLGVPETKPIPQKPSFIELHPNNAKKFQDEQKEVPENANVDNYQLTPGDRIRNTLLGAAMGLAVGGLVVATIGAGGTVIVASASQIIPLLGGTGPQTFAIGALAYNTVAMLVAPILGLEMEPIEVEP